MKKLTTGRLSIALLWVCLSAGLSACAEYEVIKRTQNAIAPIPLNSLSLHWKSGEVAIRIVKQERGQSMKANISEQENLTVGPIATQSAKVISFKLLPLLQSELAPYLTLNNSSASSKFTLKIELQQVVIDTTGPRRAIILTQLIPTNQTAPIWQVLLEVDASKSTSDEELLKKCAAAIKSEMRASNLIN